MSALSPLATVDKLEAALVAAGDDPVARPAAIEALTSLRNAEYAKRNLGAPVHEGVIAAVTAAFKTDADRRERESAAQTRAEIRKTLEAKVERDRQRPERFGKLPRLLQSTWRLIDKKGARSSVTAADLLELLTLAESDSVIACPDSFEPVDLGDRR